MGRQISDNPKAFNLATRVLHIDPTRACRLFPDAAKPEPILLFDDETTAFSNVLQGLHAEPQNLEEVCRNQQRVDVLLDGLRAMGKVGKLTLLQEVEGQGIQVYGDAGKTRLICTIRLDGDAISIHNTEGEMVYRSITAVPKALEQQMDYDKVPATEAEKLESQEWNTEMLDWRACIKYSDYLAERFSERFSEFYTRLKQ